MANLCNNLHKQNLIRYLGIDDLDNFERHRSVLNDAKYPTKAAKYWQCVREQNVFLENLMSLSFDYRRTEVKIKRLQEKLDKEEAPLKK